MALKTEIYSTLMGLNIGIAKTINFLFESDGKLKALGIPTVKYCSLGYNITSSQGLLCM